MGGAATRTVGGLTSIAAALLSGNLSVSAPTPPVHPAPTAARRLAALALPGLAPDAARPDPAAVRTRLSGPLADPLLGHPQALVVDAVSGQVLLDDRGSVASVPASTLKTVTAAAALSTFRADQTVETRVAYSGPAAAGSPTANARPSRPPAATGGTLYLVGGGDPTLTAAPGATGAYPAPARLTELVDQVKRSGVTEVARVVGDGSLFAGPAMASGWRDSYRATGNVTPVSALEVDGGRDQPGSSGPRSPDPTLQAAQAFAGALRAAGVQVGSVGTGAAPAGAAEVASVRSAPIPALVERMLALSDDDEAEAFGRLVARAKGLPATFTGAAQALTATLRGLGVASAGLHLVDASGLSPDDRIAPATLVALLRLATQPGHDNLRPLVSGLPVAGFNGTLALRYQSPAEHAAAGDVRAKTGSLREVTGLAGQAVDADGRLLLFALLAPVAQSDATSAALDRVATALATCGCGPS